MRVVEFNQVLVLYADGTGNGLSTMQFSGLFCLHFKCAIMFDLACMQQYVL